MLFRSATDPPAVYWDEIRSCMGPSNDDAVSMMLSLALEAGGSRTASFSKGSWVFSGAAVSWESVGIIVTRAFSSSVLFRFFFFFDLSAASFFEALSEMDPFTSTGGAFSFYAIFTEEFYYLVVS